jgi:hypothetical protein
MALSGSKDFTVTRDDIIETALKKIGAYDSGESVPAAELADAATALNLILKEWSAEGVSIALREQAILILNYQTQKYALGNIGTTGTTDNFHFFKASELIEGALTTAAVATATTLEVTSTTWLDSEGKTVAAPAASDNIILRLDDNTYHFDTISGVAGDTVTMNDVGGAGLASGAAIGNKIYTYTTRLTRPVRVLYAYRSDTGRNDSQLDLVGRREYERLSAKNSSGPPTKVHFSPTVDQWTAGATAVQAESAANLFVWPVKNPANVDKIVMVTEHYADDFDAATNNLQLPVEWSNALVWNLAADLAYEYGTDTSTAPTVIPARNCWRLPNTRNSLFSMPMM